MGDIDRFIVNTYYPTLMSLRKLIRNLKLEPEHYHLDIMSMRLTIHKHGLILQPGDSYSYRLPTKKIKVIT
jgi:hypothetical protein